MAALEDESGKIQVRVVYDGPALAGKTSNVQALCHAFSDRRRSELMSPGTGGERTMFLDWLQVDTGLVAGRRLSCHFITVPGQRVLSRRRDFLLTLADVAVYVCSAEPEMLSETISCFLSLKAHFKRCGQLLPLVVQLNKTDLPNALDESRLRKELDLADDVAVVSAVATERTGVRETAVLAIRKAADLVQNQILANGLGSLRSPEGDAEEIRQWILEHERKDGRSPVDVVLQARSLSSYDTEETPAKRRDLSPNSEELLAVSTLRPPLPVENVSSGMVWPANEGREHLKRALRQPADAGKLSEGVFQRDSGFWTFSTNLGLMFESSEAAKAALLAAARQSIHLGDLCIPRLVWCISQGRNGEAWLWRVAPDPAPLDDHLVYAISSKDTARIARYLELFVEAQVKLEDLQKRLGVRVGRSLIDLGLMGDRVYTFQWTGPQPTRDLSSILAEPLCLPGFLDENRSSYLECIANAFGSEIRDEVVAIQTVGESQSSDVRGERVESDDANRSQLSG